MSQRIRYVSEDENIVRSARNFPSNDGDVFVRFNKSSYQGEILSASTGTVVSSFSGRNLHDLKKLIKEHLAQVGVLFAVESRKSRGENNA